MWHEDNNYKSNERGQVAIIAIIVVTLILVSVVFSISFVAVTNYQIAGAGDDSVQAYFLAESGMEDALIHLRRDLLYTGGTYNSDMGTYVITVNKSGNDFAVRSEGYVEDTVRVVVTSLTISMQTERITGYVSFGGDNINMGWWSAIVEGNLLANDDINFTNDSKVYGDIISAGRGSFFTSWVNWGAEILDNPATTDFIEGNIISVNAIKVWGGHISGDAYSENGIYKLWGGVIDGDEYEYQDLSAVTERIEIPLFDYETYQTEAQNNGTYFSSVVQFNAYVNSLDDGNTRTLPDGVYYIENGNIRFGPGSKIILNGTIVTEGFLEFYCGVEINAQNDLPAIVAQKGVEFQDYGWPQYGGDLVTINGIVYSERDIVLKHDNSSKQILINGATWAGDDLTIEHAAKIIYDPNVVNTAGFGFASATDSIELHSWQEVL